MFSGKKLSQAWKKKKVLVKNIFTQTHFTALNINCLLKCHKKKN